VEKFVVKTSILPKNIYVMDKSGVPSANQRQDRVVGQ